MEVFDSEVQTIVECTCLQTNVVTLCGLPLQLRILDIFENQSCSTIKELRIGEVSTSSIVVNVIITAYFIATSELQIIDSLHIKPLL